MTTLVSLRTLKATELERRRHAVAALVSDLTAYARAHAGRFVLYGSAARDTMRHNSDVDILVDFPPEGLDDAWVFAEEACRRHGLSPDIRPKSLCSSAFLAHIGPDARVIA